MGSVGAKTQRPGMPASGRLLAGALDTTSQPVGASTVNVNGALRSG